MLVIIAILAPEVWEPIEQAALAAVQADPAAWARLFGPKPGEDGESGLERAVHGTLSAVVTGRWSGLVRTRLQFSI